MAEITSSSIPSSGTDQEIVTVNEIAITLDTDIAITAGQHHDRRHGLARPDREDALARAIAGGQIEHVLVRRLRVSDQVLR
jgi:hypothetical protein